MVIKKRNHTEWEVGPVLKADGSPANLSDYNAIIYQVKAKPEDTTVIISATLAASEIAINKPETGWITITLTTAKTTLLTANRKLHHAVKFIAGTEEYETELTDEEGFDAEHLEVKQHVITPAP
ncbi:MAG: hypothetical protein KA369_08370 [Spirochaetes bacterium]|nr:hypothetical protein [Spirochaetota bacterium]